MAEDSLEERSLEILGIPDHFDPDLLWLYLENKRRSGGGDVESLDRCGNKVLVVFTEVEGKSKIFNMNSQNTLLQVYVSKSLQAPVSPILAAAGVLSKGSHVLLDTTFTARRKPPKDPGKLLLKGLNPNTGLDFLELYVENITDMEVGRDISLFPSPSKDLVLIHLNRPLTKGL